MTNHQYYQQPSGTSSSLYNPLPRLAFVQPTFSIAALKQTSFVSRRTRSPSRRRPRSSRAVQSKLSVRRDSGGESGDAYKQFSDLLSKSDRDTADKDDDMNDTTSPRESEDEESYIKFDQRLGGVKRIPTQAETEQRQKQMYDEFARRLGEGDDDDNNDEKKVVDEGSVGETVLDEAQEKKVNAEKQQRMNQQYAEFAQRLGPSSKLKKPKGATTMKTLDRNAVPTEKDDDEEDEERTTIEQASKPAAPPVSAADYARFDSLLSRSGGAQRKPLKKASRRWATAADVSAADDDDDDNDTDTDKEEAPPGIRPPPRSAKLSRSDTEEGYAMMQDAFGSGFHRKSNSPTPPRSVFATPSAPKLDPLLKPPQRPVDLSASQTLRDLPKFVYDDDFEVPSAEVGPLPDLQPKPARPVSADEQQDVAQPQPAADNTQAVSTPAPLTDTRTKAPATTRPTPVRKAKLQLDNKPQRPASLAPEQPRAQAASPAAELRTKPKTDSKQKPLDTSQTVSAPLTDAPRKVQAPKAKLESKPERRATVATEPPTKATDTSRLQTKAQKGAEVAPSVVNVPVTEAVNTPPVPAQPVQLRPKRNAPATPILQSEPKAPLVDEDATGNGELQPDDDNGQGMFQEAVVQESLDVDTDVPPTTGQRDESAVQGVDATLTDRSVDLSSQTQTSQDSAGLNLLPAPARPQKQKRVNTRGSWRKNSTRPGLLSPEERWEAIEALVLENPKRIVRVQVEELVE